MRRETTTKKIVSAHELVASRFFASKVTTTLKKLANSAERLLFRAKTKKHAFVQTVVLKRQTLVFTERTGSLSKKAKRLFRKLE